MKISLITFLCVCFGMALAEEVDLLKLVAVCHKAAEDGGKIAKDILQKGDLGIVDKGGLNNLQTEADRSVERLIVSTLRALFPTVHLRGEEDSEDVDITGVKAHHFDDIIAELSKNDIEDKDRLANAEDVVVWIDPLDGTAEYTQGLLDHVTILIGIAVKGKAVAGVIHQPFYNYENEANWSNLGRTIWSLSGLGFRGITPRDAPSGELIVTTTRSHGDTTIEGSIAAVKPTKVLRVGGSGHKVLMVIEGEAHLYLFASKGTKKWDTCAPEAILRATGGLMVDMFGREISYEKTSDHVNRGGLIAAREKTLVGKTLDAVPKELLKNLS